MTRIVLSAGVALLVAASLAAADPPIRYSTCDHAGLVSTANRRHVNYLSVQSYYGCEFAQRVARIWVHDACVTSCNVWEGRTAIAFCTSQKDSGAGPEWTTRCTKSGSTAVIIGWVRTG
jgi:hypothetical protein